MSFESVEKVIHDLHTEDRKKTVLKIVEYGRHLDNVRKQEEHKNVISSAELLKYLVEHGMPVDLSIQIREAIDNPEAEIIIT